MYDDFHGFITVSPHTSQDFCQFYDMNSGSSFASSARPFRASPYPSLSSVPSKQSCTDYINTFNIFQWSVEFGQWEEIDHLSTDSQEFVSQSRQFCVQLSNICQGKFYSYPTYVLYFFRSHNLITNLLLFCFQHVLRIFFPLFGLYLITVFIWNFSVSDSRWFFSQVCVSPSTTRV